MYPRVVQVPILVPRQGPFLQRLSQHIERAQALSALSVKHTLGPAAQPTASLRLFPTQPAAPFALATLAWRLH